MQVVILAGGKGTRLSDFTHLVPKPMVKIGKQPILMNIIDHYLYYNFNDIFISTGYKNKLINNYFLALAKIKNISKLDIIEKKNFLSIKFNKFKINIVYTGLNTGTSGRINKLKKFLNKESFMFTYGDGLSNINLFKLKKFHRLNKSVLTLTAVRPPARFGELKLKNNLVKSFDEKPQLQNGWINGGFFVAEPSFFNFIKKNNEMLERDPIKNIAKKKKLFAFKHEGFWQCMDNLRDYQLLKKLNNLPNPPWKNF